MTFIKATAGCQLAQVMHRKPDSRLAEHVSSIAVLDGRSAEHPDRVFVLPDGRSTLLFNLHHLHRSVIGAGATAPHLQSSAAVLGPASRSYSKTVTGAPVTFVITFRVAGAHPVLGVPMTELKDKQIDLRELWGSGADKLVGRLWQASSHQERINVLEAYLCDRLDECSARSLRVSRALEAISQHGRRCIPGPSRSSLSSLCLRNGISSRNLRRLFSEGVGIGPGELFRIERFNLAVSLASGCERPDWAEIASRSGYYDQAHLIASFRQFSSLTPATFLGAIKDGLPHLSGCWFKTGVADFDRRAPSTRAALS